MHLGVLVFATVLGQFFLLHPQILKQLGCHSLGVCSCWGIHWKSHRILWECRNAIILSSPSSVVGQQLVTQMIHWSGTPWHWNRQQKNTAKGPFESAIRLDMIRLPFMTTVRSFDAPWSIRWKHVCLEIFIAQWDVVGVLHVVMKQHPAASGLPIKPWIHVQSWQLGYPVAVRVDEDDLTFQWTTKANHIVISEDIDGTSDIIDSTWFNLDRNTCWSTVLWESFWTQQLSTCCNKEWSSCQTCLWVWVYKQIKSILNTIAVNINRISIDVSQNLPKLPNFPRCPKKAVVVSACFSKRIFTQELHMHIELRSLKNLVAGSINDSVTMYKIVKCYGNVRHGCFQK